MIRYAEVNGAKLAYEVSGNGAPIIFVHGFMARSTESYYQDFKERLTSGHRVYALDMRSHGGSAAVSDNATLEQSAHDVVAFADLLDLDDAVLVGHSMGGFISLAAAALRPKRFKALAILTPAASKGQPTSEEQIGGFTAARANTEIMDQWFASMFVAPPGQTNLTALREAALCLPDAVAEQWMRTEWPNSDLTGQLSGIQLPALFLLGAKDSVVPPQSQYEDALRVPKAKVVTFADEGHMLPIEGAERSAKEILRFLQDVAA